ncbi:MAG: CXXX repeat peptide maturase [Muribaculaceae bacterium]|nr:CXXX repeat peptide maturase [Muribaculaceae bacterium]
MLKYLIVQLDDSAPSFCHYTLKDKDQRLIPLDLLEKALIWAMKENLNVQFIYPESELPTEYKKIIDFVDHADIASVCCEDNSLVRKAEVLLLSSLSIPEKLELRKGCAYVWRTTISDFLINYKVMIEILPHIDRINVVFTDVINFKDSMKAAYSAALDRLAQAIVSEYKHQHQVQLNLLTDRMLLNEMNNCNAGDESITLCPDGKFYVCPAFYSDEENAVGDLNSGPFIMNEELLKLSYAPICRICDAWQCRRCVWMNRELTHEVNTPGHEQCLMAHIERNASARLARRLRNECDIKLGKDFTETECLDPFERLNN